MALRALAVWCGLLVIGILNGAIRQRWVVPRLGEIAAHWISTLSLCAGIVLISWITVPWVDPRTSGDSLFIGVLWAALTIAFEFLAGHFLFGNSWQKLVADYQLFQGRIWLLVPVTLLFSPWMVSRA
jgi:hypothetical protein